MKNSNRYINTSQIDAISGGDNAFKKELIDIFLEQIEEFVSNMRKYFAEQNWKELAKEAHTAKSSAMTFGMDETGKLLKEIQQDAEGEVYSNLSEKVERATSDLKNAIPELHQLKSLL
jgi:HPt (histidine-containing phosphotransfer) domain-containing protein